MTTDPQALDELISSDELAEMDLLAERSAGLAFAGTVRRLVAAYRSLAPIPSDEIRERVAEAVARRLWNDPEHRDWLLARDLADQIHALYTGRGGNELLERRLHRRRRARHGQSRPRRLALTPGDTNG